MKFPIPSQLQTTYNQATHFLGNFSWQPITRPIANLTSTWEKLCAPEASFYMQANQEISFRNYQKWRTDFKFSLEDLLQDIVIQYQQGKPFTNESIEQELISLQPTENLSSFSLPYYHSSLKQLALQLPAYASTIDKVNYYYREQLKAHPLKALVHFYHDIINSIIRLSGEQLSLDDLEKLLKYYEKFELVPSSLYQAVRAQFETFKQNNKPIHSPDPFVMTPNSVYENLIKGINRIFKEEINKQIPAEKSTAVLPTQSAQTFFNGSLVNETWKNTQKALSSSWDYLKANSETILGGTAAVGLGVSILYKLSQTNNPSHSSLSELNEGHLLMNGLSVIADMATVVNYLSKSYLPPLLKSAMVTRQMTVPLFTIGLMYLQSVSSQPTERWFKTLGGNSIDAGNWVQQTSDDGYIVTGYTTSFGVGSVDLWLSKWAANGTLTWVKTLGGSDFDAGNWVQQTGDEGYIVTGYTASFDTGSDDLWLSKWAANGTLTWVKTLGGSGDDRGSSVQQTTDEGYIVTGFTTSFGAGGYDLWLSKWAVNGTLTWVKTLGGSGADMGYSVQQTTDEGYIVTGFTASFGAGGYDLCLSKWAANGTLTWVKTLGGSGDDEGYSVQQTSDEGYIVTGYTTSFGAGGADLWLSKWATNGALTWVKILGGSGDDEGFAVQQTRDEGYIVTGYTANFGAGNDDLWLTKWDSQDTIGDGCESLMNITSVALALNSSLLTLTPEIPSLSPQDVLVSPQTVSPSIRTYCYVPPTLSGTGGSFTYTENDPATVIDAMIVINDADDTLLKECSSKH